MVKLNFDDANARGSYGVDHGVIYIGTNAYPWNGLISIEESFSGGTSDYIYVDGLRMDYNTKKAVPSYTITAYMYPEEFNACIGYTYVKGLTTDNYRKRQFSLSWQSKVIDRLGNKKTIYHLLYNLTASISGRSYNTTTSSIDAEQFKFDVLALDTYSSTALFYYSYVNIDSSKLTSDKITKLENLLYGTSTTNASIPSLDTIQSTLSIQL